jgi:hypothetical protein
MQRKPCFGEGKWSVQEKILFNLNLILFITGESLQGLGRGDAEFVGRLWIFFHPF